MVEGNDVTLSEPLITEHDSSSDDETLDNGKSWKQRITGLMYGFASGVCSSLSSVIVKLTTDFTAVQFTFLRAVGMFLVTALVLMYQKRNPIPQDNRLKLLSRGTTAYLALLLSYVAYKNLPLGDASVIVFSTPVFVTVLGCAFLAETCTLFHTGVVLLSMIGIVLVSRPTFLFSDSSGGNTLGVAAACFSVFFLSVTYILVRTLQNVHSLLIILYTSALSVVYSAVLCLCLESFKFPQNKEELILISINVFLSFLSQVFMTKGLQVEEAGAVSISRSLDIVVVFIWQYLFFHTEPSALSICGAALVTVSVILMALKKLEIKKPKPYIKEASS